MKNALFFAALILLAGCGKNDDPRPAGETTEHYVDASAADVWHYFSLSNGELVGSAADAPNTQDNPKWRTRDDWDIAIQRYKIRTNNGVWTPDGDNKDEFGNILVATSFASIDNVPAGAAFSLDKPIQEEGMGAPGIGGVFTTVVRSEAAVVQMWRNSLTGPPTMPPDYRAAPVYVFRSADGEEFYKVEFTQYQNDEGASGHVRFTSAQIYR